ncbi:MAG: tryptophan synthase subunit alpha [Candidatus Methanomethylophilaceae archaeon]|nr:tryptophan synthase subunit alpha [Candidatus Methanomethylophilaceae archaeon]MBR4217349.1 tryptophan synthase subunit alpha [Candidatus Methanomethylophilaceae archaeon]MBR4698260.1 tryptophan synthase subunit alpha [Candidatus Methanomethylophilaceae archaeon]MBR6870312.1 tryptophan synthase subunit alpha [Candidatus Methanomethylophilaceae archaeon]
MTEIRDAFSNGKALIAFVTCGDPDLDTTKAIVRSMASNGVDLIELGIPFSDPTAEGPVIQGANVRALKAGTTTDKIFDMVESIRDDVDIPMVFMTYANVVFSYGTDRFLDRCVKAGIKGLILPDVPFEEKEDFAPACEKHGMCLISMVAPTSHERIAMIAKESKGFLYVVSSLGVTGTRSKITTDIGSITEAIKKVTDTPCAVGFGISNPQQAKDMSKKADGVIIGSAIVRLVAEYGRDSAKPVGEFVKSVKEAMRSQ